MQPMVLDDSRTPIGVDNSGVSSFEYANPSSIPSAPCPLASIAERINIISGLAWPRLARESSGKVSRFPAIDPKFTRNAHLTSFRATNIGENIDGVRYL